MEPHRALQAEHLVSVSASARQLVDSLLLPEPGDRLTAEQALAQSWLTGYLHCTAVWHCTALCRAARAGEEVLASLQTSWMRGMLARCDRCNALTIPHRCYRRRWHRLYHAVTAVTRLASKPHI